MYSTTQCTCTSTCLVVSVLGNVKVKVYWSLNNSLCEVCKLQFASSNRNHQSARCRGNQGNSVSETQIDHEWIMTMHFARWSKAKGWLYRQMLFGRIKNPFEWRSTDSAGRRDDRRHGNLRLARVANNLNAWIKLRVSENLELFALLVLHLRTLWLLFCCNVRSNNQHWRKIHDTSIDRQKKLSKLS